MEKTYVFLADGFEEIEGLTVVDILRRAGVETKTVSVSGNLQITGSHGIVVQADVLFDEASLTDGTLFVLPGGMPGTLHLKEHDGLRLLLTERFAAGKRVAAICAAPTALGAFGILKGKKAVCYPGMEDGLTGATALTVEVVTDGTVTTSRGMGTAIPFSLELVRLLCGEEAAAKLGKVIVYRQE